MIKDIEYRITNDIQLKLVEKLQPHGFRRFSYSTKKVVILKKSICINILFKRIIECMDSLGIWKTFSNLYR